MTPSPDRLERWDKRYLWHPFTQQLLWEKEPAIVVKSGRGAYFTDERGRRYLDGVSSLWVNLHGHRHPKLDAAVRRQLGRIAHSTFLGLTHAPGILLAKELARIAPKGLTRTFYSDNGATAVEVALKMAFQFWLETEPGRPPRTEFLALKGSYHGDTLGAVSVGSIGAFHSKFKPLLFKSHFTDHTVAATEKILTSRRGKIAAAIVEPVMQGATGMNLIPKGFLTGLRRLCDKHGVLLIADEVATGFGRTGRMFACEHEGVRPDFLCLAKGLTGGYTPLAATMTTERIFRAFRAPLREGRTFFHGHSYTGHPLGAAVALENLALFRRERTVEKVRKKAHLLRMELRALEKNPHVGSVRQAGLMAGVQLVGFPAARRAGAAVCRRLLKDGIWLRPLGDTVVLMPPYVISDADLKRLVRRLSAAIDEVGA